MGKRRRHQRIDRTPQLATIDSLSHDGWGIARIQGKATFIQGALPGEKVEFVYTEKKKDYDKGICQSVIEQAEDRVNPPCPHYSVCGGCSFQHLDPEKQIHFKQQVLMENLSHIGGVEPETVLSPLVGDRLGYRHKARLSVRYVAKKDAVLVGFRERLSGRFIADINQCEILHPKVGRIITPLRQLIATLTNFQAIAQVEVAIGDNKTVFILRHLKEFDISDFEKLREFAALHNISWYIQPGGEDTIHSLEPEDQALLTYRYNQMDINYQFKPNDFTQVNPSINQQMIHKALSLLEIESTDRVLDLFCGLGNFSLPIAKQALAVVGVEGCNKMTQRAFENAERNHINNARFYQADLFEDFTNADWAQSSYDKILLDPPRAGAKELCERIKYFNAKTIVYISCSTTTLARDAKLLCEQGYQLSAAGVMDMFPHTAHVESVAVFIKK